MMSLDFTDLTKNKNNDEKIKDDRCIKSSYKDKEKL